MHWGILATGTIANKFAKTVVQMQQAGEDQQLVACASRSKEKSVEFGGNYGLAAGQCYGSYEEMVADPQVEAVYIATPNNMHFENALMCLNAGKHVLCEKPFTTTAADAAKLFEVAKEKGLFIMEAFWIRFLPCLIKMQEIIASGEIGDVVSARSDYGFIAKGARKDRKFAKELAGGALLDIGVYNLGFMRMVMGDRHPVSYSADYHINEYGTDDFSAITLRYANSAKATVEQAACENNADAVPGASATGDYATAHITTSIGIEIPRNALVCGTKGRIEFDDFQNASKMIVTIYGEQPTEYSFPVEMGGFEYEIREVSQCVAAGKTSSDILKNSHTLEITGLMEKLLKEWE